MVSIILQICFHLNPNVEHVSREMLRSLRSSVSVSMCYLKPEMLLTHRKHKITVLEIKHELDARTETFISTHQEAKLAALDQPL